MVVFYFFFSSRRRHTRYWRDWSSDVCSSDLRGNRRASATAPSGRPRCACPPPSARQGTARPRPTSHLPRRARRAPAARGDSRSEEHTSELQSRQYLVCRLLLEKKKKKHAQGA